MVYKPTQRRALKDATKRYRSKKIQHPVRLVLPIIGLVALTTFCIMHFAAGL